MVGIERFDVRRVSVPLASPYRESIAEVHAFHHVVTVVEADGVRGVGEGDFLNVTPHAAPVVAHALRELVAPRLLGAEPHDVEGVLALARGVLSDALGPVAVHSALAAVDLALHDLRGRLLGLPVHALLGGHLGERIPVSFTLSAAPAAEMADAARQRVAQGYRTVVVKAGRGSRELDVERVAGVRAAVGPDVRLRVDLNGGYERVDEAADAIRRFAEHDLELVEQPLPRGDVGALRALRDAVDVPIAADESLVTLADAFELARADAVDLFNVKVTKCGGLTTSMKIAAVAESVGIPCLVGGHPTAEIARQASRHFAVAAPGVDLRRAHEGPGPASQALVDQLTEQAVTYDDVARLGGAVPVPDGPGLDVVLREDVVERHAS